MNGSALSLLVFFIRTNDENHASASNNFTIPANLFYWSLHLHGSSPQITKAVTFFRLTGLTHPANTPWP